VSALGHYLEDEMIPTVSISLIRPHVERIRPPRSLWVPFELGRPLGAPGDPAFQTRVLRAALELLEAEPGPHVLRDFPADAPGGEFDAGWKPGVALPPAPSGESGPGALVHQMRAEVAALEPAYARHVAEGRTTVGVSGLPVPECVNWVEAFLSGQAPASPRADLPAVQVLRFAVDDLKAYYLEALSAGPGRPNSVQMQNWFWDTAAGRAIVGLRAVLSASADKRSQAIGKGSLVPRAQVERLGLG
jgi:hypothetical protein